MIDFLKRNTTLSTIYIGNLLLSFHYYLIIYVNSSFLSQFFSNAQLSFLYSGGAALNVILFLMAPRIIRKIGVYHFLLISVALEGIAIGGLIFAHNALSAGFFFTIHQVIVATILLSLDIFLENATKEEGRTGRMRSLYLTISNATLVISPIIIGLIVSGDNYSSVYTISAILIVPLLLIIISGLRDTNVEPPAHFETWKSVKGLLRHENVKWVTGAQLILQIFYAWMIIYTPIYLHEYIGFDWKEIGLMFTIMLLPFIIFEIPIGKLADDRYGEKEFMIFGFIVMMLSLFLMPLLVTQSFILWTSVLFLSRVGASFVEITTESYFFKQVVGGDSDWISLFRTTHSLGYIFAPLLATACIAVLPFSFMFTVLGVVVVFGIFCGRNLIDTK